MNRPRYSPFIALYIPTSNRFGTKRQRGVVSMEKWINGKNVYITATFD